MRIVFALAALLLASAAIAAPVVSVSLSPTSGVAPYTSTLTWTATGAASCTASDGWTGAKAVTGTQTVTVSAVTKYTLTCVASDGQTTTAWLAPTQNTDNSTLADLAGFNIYRGTTATNLVRVKSVGPSVLSYQDTGLASGSYYYQVSAVNAASRESTLSKSTPFPVVVSGSNASASATASIETIPNPPAGVTTTTLTAYEYRPATNSFAAIGLVPAGAHCGPQTRTAGTLKYCRVALADSRPVVWPQDRSLSEVWVRQ